MSSSASVTCWLGQLQAGNVAVAQALWERYFPQLVDLARARLRGRSRGIADEEDVALAAFDSFCRGAQQGRFPRLGDRDDLWSLLVTITARKAARQVRDERRQKRGGHRTAAPTSEALDFLPSPEPDPQFAAEIAEGYQHLLDRLDDPSLRAVALKKMEGYTNQEIADQCGCAPRTVERKLRLIRATWEQEVPE